MTKYISLQEAGKILGFGSDKMYRMARGDPDFPVVKIGGQYRVSEEELKAYIKSKYISKGGKISAARQSLNNAYNYCTQIL